jgi:hypothetical protein
MQLTFDGHLPAQSEAEMQALKLGKETWVYKSNAGGIKYYVVDSIKNIPEDAKILDHYNKKGEKVDVWVVWVSEKVKVTQ